MEILQTAGLSEADVDDIPAYGTSTLKPPPIVTCTTDLNWPSVSVGESFFDRALANGNLENGDTPYLNGHDTSGAAASSALDAWANEEKADEAFEADEDGWDLDAGGEETQAEKAEEAD